MDKQSPIAVWLSFFTPRISQIVAKSFLMNILLFLASSSVSVILTSGRELFEKTTKKVVNSFNVKADIMPNDLSYFDII